MAQCRSCRARIIWVETEATAKKPGRRIPLDVDPENPAATGKFDNGTIVFTGMFTGDGTPIVRVIRPGPDRARAHWSSCPDAAKHRRS